MPVMTVKIPVTNNDLANVAEWVWSEFIWSEFEYEVIEFSGLREDEFYLGLIGNQEFQMIVAKYVVEYGQNFLDAPGDWITPLDFGGNSFQLFTDLITWLRTVEDIIDDADCEVEDNCSAAIEILKRAGYKIVKT